MSSLRSQPEVKDLLAEILLRLPPQSSSLLRDSPLEVEDFIAEILLRLGRSPPPTHMPPPSASAGASSYLSADSASTYHRRTPPLLGCYIERFDSLAFINTMEAPNRIPPGRLSLLFAYCHIFQPLGCRHGLALISDLTREQFLVWDPVTGDQHQVAAPPGLNPKTTPRVNGAVLRAAGDIHFQVVIVATTKDHTRLKQLALACVYSSETGLWGDLISTPNPAEPDSGVDPCEILFGTMVCTDSAVLVRDSLYWKLTFSSSILEFDLEKQSLAVIQMPIAGARGLAWAATRAPPACLLQVLAQKVCSISDWCKEKLPAWLHCPGSNSEPLDVFECESSFTVIRADGGGLGILFVSNYTAKLWERNTDCDGVASWVLGRTIELDKLLSLDSEVQGNIMILGFAEENNMVFLWTAMGTFMVQIQSLQFKKLPEFNLSVPYYPFESVYNADIGGEHDGGQICHYDA